MTFGECVQTLVSRQVLGFYQPNHPFRCSHPLYPGGKRREPCKGISLYSSLSALPFLFFLFPKHHSCSAGREKRDSLWPSQQKTGRREKTIAQYEAERNAQLILQDWNEIQYGERSRFLSGEICAPFQISHKETRLPSPVSATQCNFNCTTCLSTVITIVLVQRPSAVGLDPISLKPFQQAHVE